jgi:hypothetical protein
MDTGGIYDTISVTPNNAYGNLWVVFIGIVVYFAIWWLGLILIAAGLYHFFKALMRR